MYFSWQKGDRPLPGYRLRYRLGRGGFGEVWQCSTPGGGEAAVKFLDVTEKPGQCEFSALARVRRIRHAKLIALGPIYQLDFDRNVVGLDIDAADDSIVGDGSSSSINVPSSAAAKFYLHPDAVELAVVMELADMTLRKHAQSFPGAKLPLEELLVYMADSAAGIDHLNLDEPKRAGGDPIIHCDIKPENILLLPGAAKVADFGVAQLLDNLNRTTLEVAKSVYYAPPELLDNRPALGSDQYALAIVYYELRTGAVPFDERVGRRGIELVHREGRLDFSGVSPLEQAVLRRATDLRAEHRFARCSEFVDALRAAIATTREAAAAPVDLGPRVGAPAVATPSEVVAEKRVAWTARAKVAGAALLVGAISLILVLAALNGRHGDVPIKAGSVSAPVGQIDSPTPTASATAIQLREQILAQFGACEAGDANLARYVRIEELVGDLKERFSSDAYIPLFEVRLAWAKGHGPIAQREIERFTNALGDSPAQHVADTISILSQYDYSQGLDISAIHSALGALIDWQRAENQATSTSLKPNAVETDAVAKLILRLRDRLLALGRTSSPDPSTSATFAQSIERLHLLKHCDLAAVNAVTAVLLRQGDDAFAHAEQLQAIGQEYSNSSNAVAAPSIGERSEWIILNAWLELRRACKVGKASANDIAKILASVPAACNSLDAGATKHLPHLARWMRATDLELPHSRQELVTCLKAIEDKANWWPVFAVLSHETDLPPSTPEARIWARNTLHASMSESLDEIEDMEIARAFSVECLALSNPPDLELDDCATFLDATAKSTRPYIGYARARILTLPEQPSTVLEAAVSSLDMALRTETAAMNQPQRRSWAADQLGRLSIQLWQSRAEPSSAQQDLDQILGKLPAGDETDKLRARLSLARERGNTQREVIHKLLCLDGFSNDRPDPELVTLANQLLVDDESGAPDRILIEPLRTSASAIWLRGQEAVPDRIAEADQLLSRAASLCAAVLRNGNLRDDAATALYNEYLRLPHETVNRFRGEFVGASGPAGNAQGVRRDRFFGVLARLLSRYRYADFRLIAGQSRQDTIHDLYSDAISLAQAESPDRYDYFTGRAGNSLDQQPNNPALAAQDVHQALGIRPAGPAANRLLAHTAILTARGMETRRQRAGELEQALKGATTALHAADTNDPDLAEYLRLAAMAGIELANCEPDLARQLALLRQAVKHAEGAAQEQSRIYPDEALVDLGHAYEDLAWLGDELPDENYRRALQQFRAALAVLRIALNTNGSILNERGSVNLDSLTVVRNLSSRARLRVVNPLLGMGRVCYRFREESGLNPAKLALVPNVAPSRHELLEAARDFVEAALFVAPDDAAAHWQLASIHDALADAAGNTAADGNAADRHAQSAWEAAWSGRQAECGVFARHWAIRPITGGRDDPAEMRLRIDHLIARLADVVGDDHARSSLAAGMQLLNAQYLIHTQDARANQELKAALPANEPREDYSDVELELLWLRDKRRLPNAQAASNLLWCAGQQPNRWDKARKYAELVEKFRADEHELQDRLKKKLSTPGLAAEDRQAALNKFWDTWIDVMPEYVKVAVTAADRCVELAGRSREAEECLNMRLALLEVHGSAIVAGDDPMIRSWAAVDEMETLSRDEQYSKLQLQWKWLKGKLETNLEDQSAAQIDGKASLLLDVKEWDFDQRTGKVSAQGQPIE